MRLHRRNGSHQTSRMFGYGLIVHNEYLHLHLGSGLDPSHYRSTTHLESENNVFTSLDSQLPDKERFKDCDSLTIECGVCHAEFALSTLLEFKVSVSSCYCSDLTNYQQTSTKDNAGIICPNAGCNSDLNTVMMQYQLERQIRKCIGKYYEGWVSCDDPTCAYRTRMMGVYGRRCLRPGCYGQTSFEVCSTLCTVLYPN
jgi:DNA polymerase alpha subunit A